MHGPRHISEFTDLILAELSVTAGCQRCVVVNLAEWRHAHARAKTKTSVATESQAVALFEGGHSRPTECAVTNLAASP